jgi:phosphinothricin acetyltransferase
MRIRPATQADLPGILAVYNHVIETSTAVYMDEPVPLADRAAWLAAREAKGFPVLVAADAGEVLGFASYGEWRGAFPGYRHSVEHSVHVREGLRGKGVGRALMEALIPIAERQGMHVMLGAVDAANEGSLRFHERLGFTRVAHFREVGRKFDRWLDLVFVQRVLGTR